MDQMVRSRSASDGSPGGCLKYKPDQDPNYSYSLTVKGKSWEAWAKGKKKGLLTLHTVSPGRPFESKLYYRPRGVRGPFEKVIVSRDACCDSWVVQ